MLHNSRGKGGTAAVTVLHQGDNANGLRYHGMAARMGVTLQEKCTCMFSLGAVTVACLARPRPQPLPSWPSLRPHPIVYPHPYLLGL